LIACRHVKPIRDIDVPTRIKRNEFRVVQVCLRANDSGDWSHGVVGTSRVDANAAGAFVWHINVAQRIDPDAMGIGEAKGIADSGDWRHVTVSGQRICGDCVGPSVGHKSSGLRVLNGCPSQTRGYRPSLVRDREGSGFDPAFGIASDSLCSSENLNCRG
jgi:hypothetical protein